MADSKSKPRAPFVFANKPKDFSKLIYTGTTAKTVPSKPSITLSKSTTTSKSTVKVGRNGLPKTNTTTKSLTPSRSTSRQHSSEPRDVRRAGKASRPSRSSPVVSTPHFESDDEDDEEIESRRKRARLGDTPMDTSRRVRDAGSFSHPSKPYTIIHAADIANNQVQDLHGHYKFGEFFSALQEDEEECPTIELQYPCGNMTERYQLVKPHDSTDYKPLSEIQDNMRIVKEFYLDAEAADEVESSDFGEGMVRELQKAAKDAGRAGFQQRFIDVVQDYNRLLSAKRDDGTISAKLDSITSPLPLKLVQHIVKDQIYARTVSAQVESVRDYKPFSDNVYGELLPKFLSLIFKETGLTSNKVFVDLGSGVGNCVLQAALEIGCESWGCEVMPNCASLAEAQAREFPSRCRMWGIRPGRVRLIQDDFTTNKDIGDALKRADVVLVNNQAFTSELNDTLKSMFLDLKEACKIVSLKYFRDPAHRVKESNINDLINCLRVEEKVRYSSMVSWSDDPGKWYVHVKDSSELRAVRHELEENGI